MSLDARLSVWGLRLQKRYLASQPIGTPQVPTINEAVTPTTDADELLKDYRAITNTVSVSLAPALKTVITNQNNSRFRFKVKAIEIALSTGTWTFDSIYIATFAKVNNGNLEDNPSATLINTALVVYSSNQTHAALMVEDGIYLYPGDSIVVNIATESVSGNLIATVYGSREFVF